MGRAQQLSLGLKTWGGKRKGAGRKPRGEQACVSRRARPKLAARFPVHVSMKLRDDIGNLKKDQRFVQIEKALVAVKIHRDSFRVVHYCLQSNHLHLVCEAKNAESLSRGLQGLAIRIARGLNGHLKRKGKVFADRYYARILKTGREVKNVLAYVLHNSRSHALRKRRSHALDRMEPFTSAPEFDGWSKRPTLRWRRTGPPPVCEPHTWLLFTGWRRWGLICP